MLDTMLPVTWSSITAGWRVESAHNGTVWQLRERGSRDNGRKRKTRYLGTIKNVSREKANEYAT